MFLSMACISCMRPFDLKFEDDPVIFLEAFPGVEDVVVFKIKPGYSLSNSAARPEFVPEIIFKVNGNEVPVVLNEEAVYGKYPEDCYIADYEPVPGDVMTVEVSSEGFGTIYAETSVPQPFPARRIDYKQVFFGKQGHNVLSVSFTDAKDDDIAYGLQIYSEIAVDNYDGEPFTNINRYTGYQIEDSFDLAPESLDGVEISFDGWTVNPGSYSTVSMWSDANFNGSLKTLSMGITGYSYESLFESREENEVYDDLGNLLGINKSHHRSKVVLFTMTDEFYKYAVAKEMESYNADTFAGIVPSNFCYTNIRGGYGAFAGVCSVETDWLTPEFIENNR